MNQQQSRNKYQLKEVSVGGGPLFGHDFKAVRRYKAPWGSSGGDSGSGGSSCTAGVVVVVVESVGNGLRWDSQRYALGCELMRMLRRQ